jgi:anti-sigma factor RsiW
MTIHYQHGEWRSYRQGQLSAGQRRQMEHHLVKCESCLKAYLAAIDEAETAAAERLLPADFSASILGRTRMIKRQTEKTQRRRILAQYAAAACITLALTASGFFDATARDLPAVINEIGTVSRVINRSAEFKWSDDLVKTASSGINKILFEKEE